MKKGRTDRFGLESSASGRAGNARIASRTLTLIPADALYFAGGAGLAFLVKLRAVAEPVYTIDVDFANARLNAGVEYARLRIELGLNAPVQTRCSFPLEQRLQLTAARIGDDLPPGE